MSSDLRFQRLYWAVVPPCCSILCGFGIFNFGYDSCFILVISGFFRSDLVVCWSGYFSIVFASILGFFLHVTFSNFFSCLDFSSLYLQVSLGVILFLLQLLNAVVVRVVVSSECGGLWRRITVDDSWVEVLVREFGSCSYGLGFGKKK